MEDMTVVKELQEISEISFSQNKRKNLEIEGIIYQLLKNREEMNKQILRRGFTSRGFTSAKLMRKGGDAM